MAYPTVMDEKLVGTSDARQPAGGGNVWDEVLEYRVWRHPHDGPPDEADGDDDYFAFGTDKEALDCSLNSDGSQAPLALILRREYLDERQPGVFRHVKTQRVTEWSVEFSSRPRRTQRTIPDFLTPDVPASRLEILRGEVAD